MRSPVGLARKLWRMPAADRRLHLQAFLAVLACRLGYRPSTEPTAGARYLPASPAAIGQAVEAAGSLVPGATCLPKAHAAASLLRRRGVRPRIRIGVRRGQGDGLEAHAWVEVDGRPVTGGDAAAGYVPLRGP